MWNWFDFSVQLIFNLEKMLLIIFSDEIDGETQVSKTTRSTNSVKIGFSVLGEIEIDDNVNWQDINTSCKNVSANQASGFSIFEIVVNSTEKINKC